MEQQERSVQVELGFGDIGKFISLFSILHRFGTGDFPLGGGGVLKPLWGVLKISLIYFVT